MARSPHSAIELEVAHFNFEVSLNLQGHLEATIVIRGTMHMNAMLLEVANFKSEVKYDL